jgi:hypothetical protein
MTDEYGAEAMRVCGGSSKVPLHDRSGTAQVGG